MFWSSCIFQINLCKLVTTYYFEQIAFVQITVCIYFYVKFFVQIALCKILCSNFFVLVAWCKLLSKNSFVQLFWWKLLYGNWFVQMKINQFIIRSSLRDRYGWPLKIKVTLLVLELLVTAQSMQLCQGQISH